MKTKFEKNVPKFENNVKLWNLLRPLQGTIILHVCNAVKMIEVVDDDDNTIPKAVICI